MPSVHPGVSVCCVSTSTVINVCRLQICDKVRYIDGVDLILYFGIYSRWQIVTSVIVNDALTLQLRQGMRHHLVNQGKPWWLLSRLSSQL